MAENTGEQLGSQLPLQSQSQQQQHTSFSQYSSTNTIKSDAADERQLFQQSPSSMFSNFKSFEVEKNLLRLSSAQDSVGTSLNVKNKLRGVIENSYKIQIQNLIEELNQAKLDKTLLEKKLELQVKNQIECFNDLRQNSSYAPAGSSTSDQCHALVERVKESENTTAKLQFQIQELSSELKVSKAAYSHQKKITDKLQAELMRYNGQGACLTGKEEVICEDINKPKENGDAKDINGKEVEEQIERKYLELRDDCSNINGKQSTGNKQDKQLEKVQYVEDLNEWDSKNDRQYEELEQQKENVEGMRVQSHDKDKGINATYPRISNTALLKEIGYEGKKQIGIQKQKGDRDGIDDVQDIMREILLEKLKVNSMRAENRVLKEKLLFSSQM